MTVTNGGPGPVPGHSTGAAIGQHVAAPAGERLPSAPAGA